MQLRNGKNTTSGPVPQGAGDTSWEMRVAIVREQCRRQIEERNQAKIEYYESLVRGALTGEGWPADGARCPYVSDEEQDEGRYSYVNDAEDWGSDWDDDDPWVRDEEQDVAVVLRELPDELRVRLVHVGDLLTGLGVVM